jgi:glycosyltransferase 2 family protein
MTNEPSARRKWLVLGGSIILTAVTLYFVFRGIDGRMFQRLMVMQNRGLLAGAAFFLLMQIAFGGERWRAILTALLRGKSPPALSVQAIFYASIFFNSLPVGTVGGDVVRVWLARRFVLSTKQLVLSVLIDRILVVAALMVLAVITLPDVRHPFALNAWFAASALLLCAVIGLLLLRPIERALGQWRDLRLVTLALRTTEEFRAVTRRGGLLGLFYAVLSAACYSLAAYCVARSLGLAVGPIAMVAIMSIVFFLGALPISLAGWGVREASVVALFGLLGVDRVPALLLSLEMGLLSTLLSLPGGAVWLALRNHR